eukprot:365583-Chlamydomonas_euryale.AAC.4
MGKPDNVSPWYGHGEKFGIMDGARHAQIGRCQACPDCNTWAHLLPLAAHCVVVRAGVMQVGSVACRPPSPTGGTLRCGTSWSDASGKCGVSCADGSNANCPAGEACYRDLAECSGDSTGEDKFTMVLNKPVLLWSVHLSHTSKHDQDCCCLHSLHGSCTGGRAIFGRNLAVTLNSIDPLKVKQIFPIVANPQQWRIEIWNLGEGNLSHQFSIEPAILAGQEEKSASLCILQSASLPCAYAVDERSCLNGGCRCDTYAVRPGDTLHSISEAVEISMIEIQRANNMGDETVLYSNQLLKIPIICPYVLQELSSDSLGDVLTCISGVLSAAQTVMSGNYVLGAVQFASVVTSGCSGIGGSKNIWKELRQLNAAIEEVDARVDTVIIADAEATAQAVQDRMNIYYNFLDNGQTDEAFSLLLDFESLLGTAVQNFIDACGDYKTMAKLYPSYVNLAATHLAVLQDIMKIHPCIYWDLYYDLTHSPMTRFIDSYSSENQGLSFFEQGGEEYVGPRPGILTGYMYIHQLCMEEKMCMLPEGGVAGIDPVREQYYNYDTYDYDWRCIWKEARGFTPNQCNMMVEYVIGQEQMAAGVPEDTYYQLMHFHWLVEYYYIWGRLQVFAQDCDGMDLDSYGERVYSEHMSMIKEHVEWRPNNI